MHPPVPEGRSHVARGCRQSGDAPPAPDRPRQGGRRRALFVLTAARPDRGGWGARSSNVCTDFASYPRASLCTRQSRRGASPSRGEVTESRTDGPEAFIPPPRIRPAMGGLPLEPLTPPQAGALRRGFL